jgi:hypothetical protein
MKTQKYKNLKFLSIAILILLFGKGYAQNGSTCGSAYIVTPSTQADLQTFPLNGGVNLWLKFNVNAATEIDIIEGFHPNLTQEIAQIQIFSGACNGLVQQSSIQLITESFLHSHQIVTVNPGDYAQITWTVPNTDFNLVLQLTTSQNICMPTPDLIIESGNNLASNILPSNNLLLPYTGKILVKAHTNFIIEKEIRFENCEFIMEYGSSIQLGPTSGGGSRKIQFDLCHLHGCDKMWFGMYSYPLSHNSLLFENSVVEDAYFGINPVGCGLPCSGVFPGGPDYTIRNSVFNNNLVGLAVGNEYAPLQIVENTIFTSRDISFTSGFPTVAQLKASNEALLLGSIEEPLKAPMSNIERGYCGIFQDQDGGYKTFGGGTAAEYNLFDRLAFGFIEVLGSVEIYNSHFQNMEYREGKLPFQYYFADELSLYSILRYEGVGIVNQSRGADFTMTVGSIYSNKKCIFKKCASAGIRAVSIRQIDIIGNTFLFDPLQPTTPFGNFGIHIYKAPYIGQGQVPHLNLNLSSNIITNANRAIGIYLPLLDYKCNIFHIDFNTISGTAGTGIEMSGLNSNLTTPNLTPNRTIYNNNISNTLRGIKLSNLFVDNGFPNKRISISSNTINLSPIHTSTVAAVGINLSSCRQIDVINNTNVLGHFPNHTVQSPFEAAYKNTNSFNCVVSCNNANHVDQAYVFEGACLPTVFTNNYMSNCYDGVVLRNNGVIGDQGSEIRPSDNYWNPSPGSFTNFKTNVYNTSVTGFTTFRVRPISGYQHPLSEDYTTLFNNSILFLPASGPFYLCNTSGTSPVSLSSSEVEKIINDSIFIDNPPESNYLKDRMIYELMRTDSLFADTATQELLDYYDALKLENVGKISEAENFLLNHDYLQASLLANAIIPNNVAEDITRRFIIIYSRWIVNAGAVLTSDEINQLLQIAALCPAQYGDAVTMARTLLKVTIEDYTEYADNCEESQSSSRLAHPKNSDKKSYTLDTQLSLSPNPSSDYVMINIPSNTQGYLEIRDLEGRKILSKILNDNTNKIDLSTFNNGIYIFTIKTNSNKILRGKLAIVSN